MPSQSSVNVELLQNLLEFEPIAADGHEVDLAEPPRDDDASQTHALKTAATWSST